MRTHSYVAILGGGPIGLEMLLACQTRGIDAHLYEAGKDVAEHVREWGHVKLFSPFGMNSSQHGREILAAQGHQLPELENLLTGKQFFDWYLQPLSQLAEMKPRISTEKIVCKIGRDRQLKGDRLGMAERAWTPFRIMIENQGSEEFVFAEIVIDCTGTFRDHNALGSGGVRCAGEYAARNLIDYALPVFDGERKFDFARKRTLVVGAGYSAATNVVALAQLAEEYPESKIIWLTRSVSPQPITPITDDQLRERAALTKRANELAMDEQSVVDWIKGCVVEQIECIDEWNGPLRVTLQSIAEENVQHVIEVDRIIANVGYRGDNSLYQELQIHECYASQGPMKLAAALLGETSADCLQQSSPGPQALNNPEPNFYIIGAKSYGRNSKFLLRTGLEQVEQVLSMICAGA